MALKACPHCGHPTPTSSTELDPVLAIGCLIPSLIVMAWFVIAILNSPPADFQTNQERLEEYHRRGEFRGYTDGDEWKRDVEAIRKLYDDPLSNQKVRDALDR